MGSRAVGAALRRRPGYATAAGNRARPRRRPRPARAGRAAGRVAPQRRTRGVRRAAAHSRFPRRRARPGTEALEEVRRTTVFTTHTPVPAGHDAFAFHLVEQHLAGCWGSMGEHREEFLALGHYDHGQGPQFNMTALAVRTAGAVNAVSRLHREVTAEMFAPLWPDTSDAERPVTADHQRRARAHVDLRRARAPARSAAQPGLARPLRGREVLGARARDLGRGSLAACASRSARFSSSSCASGCAQRWAEDPGTASRLVAGGVMLDPNALTIGFARRFTAYKRPELIFRDVERLARLLTDGRRPVQLVFAGKAHPADDAGKHHLQNIFRHAPRSRPRRPRRVRRRLRPARRAPARAGLRRVAEHAAQAARGERHERHEGGDERRAAPEHRRRLVGRGLPRATTAGSSKAGPTRPITTPWTRPTRRRSTICSKRRSCRRSTSATRAASRAGGWPWSSRPS